MNSVILNSIFHGSLKPWLISLEAGFLKDVNRQVAKIPTETLEDCNSRLVKLLKPFPELLKMLSKSNNDKLCSLTFICELPEPVTLGQHYYKSIIDTEILRYFTETMNNPLMQDLVLDVPYQIGEKTLNGIAILANQINNDLSERENVAQDITYFTLHYLRNSLLALYFSIQKEFTEYLPEVFESIEEFYLYKMDSNSDVVEMKTIITKHCQEIAKKTVNVKSKFSFGWKGGSPEKLQALFDDLCVDINFLDEEKTSVKTLVELLTSKDIEIGTPKIHLGCKTTEFVLVMDTISKYFLRLTQTTIQQSKCFWSKPANNKPSTLISSTSFSKSRAKSKTKQEVISDIKVTIDKHLS